MKTVNDLRRIMAKLEIYIDFARKGKLTRPCYLKVIDIIRKDFDMLIKHTAMSCYVQEGGDYTSADKNKKRITEQELCEFLKLKGLYNDNNL